MACSRSEVNVQHSTKVSDLCSSLSPPFLIFQGQTNGDTALVCLKFTVSDCTSFFILQQLRHLPRQLIPPSSDTRQATSLLESEEPNVLHDTMCDVNKMRFVTGLADMAYLQHRFGELSVLKMDTDDAKIYERYFSPQLALVDTPWLTPS